jgi:predicted ATPase
MLADALDLSPADRQTLLAAARPGSALDPPESAPRGFPPFPVPLTALIGRERELAALVSVLGNGASRLVTVTGAGGSGKTRLALEVGARLRRAFADGAVFVDLAPMRDANLVIPSIAGAIGVHERAGQPLRDTLAAALAGTRILVLLDNCEQVLAAAPGLTVLATSREPLCVRGERVFPLLSLPLPADDLPALKELSRVPAVALFVERAVASRPDFALIEDNASDVAAICRRLDGLPLSIELAAARARMLPPNAMLARLEQRLPFLTGGARDAPLRQRTMREAIAWSYDLLHEEEQRLFRRLGVFASWAECEAMEAITNWDGAIDFLVALERLVGHSLVQQHVTHLDEPHFRMLETVREYAAERLEAADEAEEVRHQHATWYVNHVEEASRQLLGPNQALVLKRIDAAYDNILGALIWLIGRRRIEQALRLATSLTGYWQTRGLAAEGRRWLDQALQVTEQVPVPVRAHALIEAGWLAAAHGDHASADALRSEGLRLASDCGDERLTAAALLMRGAAADQRGITAKRQ